MIGCIDSHNQDHKNIVCSWNRPPNSLNYNITHVVRDQNVETNSMHLDDCGLPSGYSAEFEKRDGQYLSFVSDTISRIRNTGLMRRYTGKLAGLEVQGDDAMHEVWVDPSKAPNEHIKRVLPVDLWYSLDGRQGKGNIMKPESQTSDSVFEEILATSFEGYFKRRFGRSVKL